MKDSGENQQQRQTATSGSSMTLSPDAAVDTRAAKLPVSHLGFPSAELPPTAQTANSDIKRNVWFQQHHQQHSNASFVATTPKPHENIVLLEITRRQQQQQQQLGTQLTTDQLDMLIAQLTHAQSVPGSQPADGTIAQLIRAQMPPSAVTSMPQRNEAKFNAQACSVVTTMPCRARGLPPDHRNRMAHFTITSDTKHGDGLVCSYPECRDQGIKFRYCAHCKAPVSRRNFRAHDHHDAGESARDGNDDGEGSFGMDSAHFIMETSQGNEQVLPMSPPKSKKQKIEVDERTKRWIQLLKVRPSSQDDDGISKWLLQVMAASDPETTAMGTDTD